MSIKERPSVRVATQEISSYAEDAGLDDEFRATWVAKQMDIRQDEYIESSYSRIFVGTWNVNGRSLRDPLTPWLTSEFEPEVYIICLQEMDLSAEALLIKDEVREEEWTASIEQSLGAAGKDYRKFASKQLVGILILMFAKADALSHIGHVATTSAGCGILGMMGNKGAVSIKFRYRDSEVCFVNSHLAAFENQVQRRNDNYHELCRRLIFAPEVSADNGLTSDGYISQSTDPVISSGSTVRSDIHGIFDNDHLIWCGDLNYRINLPDEQVKRLIKNKEYRYLVEFDQLHQQRREGRAFEIFNEGDIDFPCTYKYDLGTEAFDTSEKRRTPAWTDRVLWYTEHDEGVKQLRYTAHMELVNTSDHRPVSSIFDIRLKTVDQSRRREVLAAIHRQIDQLENDAMPSVSISSSAFDLGKVKYLDLMIRTLTLLNDGQTVAKFRFAAKPFDTSIAKPWLRIEPIEGLILPGQEEHIQISVFIGNAEAALLNMNDAKLDDILLLRLLNGKDFFVSVYGDYQPTCFATSLERLCRSSRPLRLIGESESYPEPSDQLSLPREFARMFDYLMDFGMDVPELFLHSGNKDIMSAFRDALDTNSDFPKVETSSKEDLAYSMADNILQFVVALPTSVVPTEIYEQCLVAADQSRDEAHSILGFMPRVHANVLLYVTAFLRAYLAAQKALSKESNRPSALLAEKLAVTWAKALLRPPTLPMDRRLMENAPRLSKNFMMFFISEDDVDVDSEPPEVNIDSIGNPLTAIT